MSAASGMIGKVSQGTARSRLSFENLRFRYSRRGPWVLSGFSWAVPPGRTVLLGPNGSGKSTLLGLGAGALTAHDGTASVAVDGAPRSKRDARVVAGWMPQTIRPVRGLTTREQVAYAGWLKGMQKSAALAAADELLTLVDLTSKAHEPTTKLSGGQLRRVGLAQAMVHSPTVLLLDEPTAGLDPDQRARFRTALAALPDDITVVVSTHQVDDLAQTYDALVVLEQGAIRFQGTIDAFLALAPASAARPAEAAYSQVIHGEDGP